MTMAGSAREAFSRVARARTDGAVVSGGNFVRAKLQDGRWQTTSVLRTIVAQPPKMGNSAEDLALDIPQLSVRIAHFLSNAIFSARQLRSFYLSFVGVDLGEN
jgi:hypothetical protein